MGRNDQFKPKRGLGQAITRQRRRAAQKAREEAERRNEAAKEAARQEVLRAMNGKKQEDKNRQQRFANALMNTVAVNQTAVLRAWGYQHPVYAKVSTVPHLVAWTDFKQVHCEWPVEKFPSIDSPIAVADTIAQMKGAFQHEFGHIRFTTPYDKIVSHHKTGEDRDYHTHRGQMLHKCWNMLEDMRMESLVVEAVPRISTYFGTMVANVILEHAKMDQSWLMLAGRTYLPGNVLKQSFDLFQQWGDDHGITDAAVTWFELVENYKAANTEAKLAKAVREALDFIDMINATIPDVPGDHSRHSGPGNDPGKNARKPKGDISDMFRKQDPKEGEGEGKDGQGEGTQDGSSKSGKPKKGDDGEDGDGEGRGGGRDSNDGDKSDEYNESLVGDADPDDVFDGEVTDEKHDGQSNRGEAGKMRQTEQDPDLESALKDMVTDYKQTMRADKDVLSMQWQAQEAVDVEGLPEFSTDSGRGTTPMSDKAVQKSLAVAGGIKEALNTFVSESAPFWANRQEEGVIDPLAYRTKNVGDKDFRRRLFNEANQGLDVHVSLLCDVSYSMNGTAMTALSEALYATAVACDELGIGRTFVLWSSGSENYRVLTDREAEPVIFPAMGATDPTKALDDLATHNKEVATNHLVMVFTDGEWGYDFPSLQRWSVEGRKFVYVLYSPYIKGEVDNKYHADSAIGIRDISEIPHKLTMAIADILSES